MEKKDGLFRSIEDSAFDSNEFNAYFEAILETTKEGIYIKDKDANILFANNIFLEMIGRKKEEVIGRSAFDLIPKEYVNQARASWEKVRNGVGEQYETEIYSKEGTIPVLLSHTKIKLSEEQYCVVLKDLSSEKKAKQDYEFILKTSLDGFMLCDDSIPSRILEANDSACKMLEYSHEELTTMTIPEIEAKEDPEANAKHIANIMKFGKDRFETQHRTKTGKVIDVEVSTHTNSKNKGYFYAFIRDITKRKKDEELLKLHKENLEELVSQRTLELEKKMAEIIEKEKIIQVQAQEILELSIPIIRMWEGIVAAPLIGSFDSERAALFSDHFLNAIVKTNATVALIDITGVPSVDTQTAQNLIDSINSAKLLGARVIITGIRPDIAVTIVHLGVDLRNTITCSSLEEGLKRALEICEWDVIKK